LHENVTCFGFSLPARNWFRSFAADLAFAIVGEGEEPDREFHTGLASWTMCSKRCGHFVG